MDIGTAVLGAAIGGLVGAVQGAKGAPLKYALYGGSVGFAVSLLRGRSAAAPVVGWNWPWVELPIAPKATMHTQTDPYSLFTLPKAIEQFYVHQYVVPEAKKLDQWLSSGEFVGAATLMRLPVGVPGLTTDQGSPYPLPPVYVESDMPGRLKSLIVDTFRTLRQGEQGTNGAMLNYLLSQLMKWPHAYASVQNVINVLSADF
jgi:hypothetical protein